MTKTDIIRKIARNTGYPYVECREILDEFTFQVKNGLAAGNKVIIQGLMSLEVISRNERHGRNPQTGKVVTFKPVKLVKCKISKSIKNAINGKREQTNE